MLGTADSVLISAPASDDADLDLLAILASSEESDANLLESGTAPHSPWSGEWLQDTDLWDPVPSCPLECQNDVSAELLVSLCSEPANSHLPEDASHEKPQQQNQEPVPVDNLLRSIRVPPKTSSDSPPRRQRATPLTSSREIQRRYRDRQREKAAANRTLVASMTAELQQLKEREQQLESRNALLEKLNQLNAAKPQHAMEGTSLDRFEEDTYDVHETTASEQGPAMMVSVGNRQQFLTLTALSCMSATSFSKLWASYVEEIAVLLLQDSPTAESRAWLDRLTSETSVLIGIIKALNPQAFSVFNCGDKGQGGTPGLDDTFYSKLAGVIGLSEGQIQDMLRLQRLCVTKRGLLAMERKAIIDQTARLECFDRESPNIVTQLSDLTTKLRANAAKDYKVYLRVACASRRGTWMTRMAADRGDPTRSQLLAMARLDDKEEEWQDLGRYVSFVCSRFMHDYVPLNTFLRPEQTQKNPTECNPFDITPEAIFGRV